MYAVTTTSRSPGEPVQSWFLFQRAWDECKELQCTSRDLWAGRALISLEQLDRYEIIAHGVGGIQLGGLVLTQELDIHVGPCMSVVAQYVMPEHRLHGVSPRLMRAAIRIAREADVPTIAFTHRKGPWRYETIYRSLREEAKG